jgi:hypothetical protein
MPPNIHAHIRYTGDTTPGTVHDGSDSAAADAVLAPLESEEVTEAAVRMTNVDANGQERYLIRETHGDATLAAALLADTLGWLAENP